MQTDAAPKRHLFIILLILPIFLAGCQASKLQTAVSPTPLAPITLTIPPPTVPPAATNDRISDPEDYNFQQWARFDAIYPIYDPEFETTTATNLRDDELIMGVTLGGEAKAYPITTLQFREMVNDELAGIPILVTW